MRGSIKKKPVVTMTFEENSEKRIPDAWVRFWRYILIEKRSVEPLKDRPVNTSVKRVIK
jgi:hypothetical protein